MYTDIYGRQIFNETDLCNAYLIDPEQKLNNVLVVFQPKFTESLELKNIPNCIVYHDLNISIEEFDAVSQQNWYMPEEYKRLDIAKYVLDQCVSDVELQRVGQELLLYQQYELFPLLRYCKYLVDIMTEHKIVWGVGRGSSVASYVLFLIGIHRINSIRYDLSIDEFLR
jgi:DNA polymerase III alpha subunit